MKGLTLQLSVPLFMVAITWGQFIPEKKVTIHPAVVSKSAEQGERKGPGTGLGATPPTPPAARGGAAAAGGTGRAGRAGRGGTPPPIPPPPPAPEIAAAGAAIEQTKQGERPAI